MIDILTSILHFIVYFLIILGLWIIFSKDIVHVIVKNYSNARFRSKKRKKSKLYKHIELLIYTVYGSKKATYVYTFYVITISIFFLFLIILLKQSSFIINITFPIGLSFIPYLFLRMKLLTLRVEGSYEGEYLISELLNQYKINYKNMLEAIDKTIPLLENTPYTKKLFFRLSLKLKEYRTNEELEEILKDFVFAVDTEWSKLLANNIYISLDEGTDVSIAMNDIRNELKIAKKALEESKRANVEGFTILRFLSPGIYLLMYFFSVHYMDFTFEKYIKYQFNTATGIKYFTLIVIMAVINVSIVAIFKKRKFDF